MHNDTNKMKYFFMAVIFLIDHYPESEITNFLWRRKVLEAKIYFDSFFDLNESYLIEIY